LKTLLTISLVLILTGCRHDVIDVPPEPVIVNKFVIPDCGTPPQRDPVELRPVIWQIIDDRFTLTPEGYEDLSFNVTEIWRGVEQLRNEITYYEQCLDNLKRTEQ
jgi:hypothetical protein